MSTTPMTSDPSVPPTPPVANMTERVPEDRKAKLDQAATAARNAGSKTALLDYMRQKRTPSA